MDIADGSAVDLNGGVSFTLPKGIFSQYNSMEVVLGIRPEELELADNGEDQTDMTIRLAGIQYFKKSEVLPMHIEPYKIHLFDPKTEKRLG